MEINLNPIRKKITVCVPIHDMENGAYFLDRVKYSLEQQTFTDFDVVVTQAGKMAENTNAAIKEATGEIIKILYMDDFLWSRDALSHLAENFTGGWYASGCVHTPDGVTFHNPHVPSYNHEVRNGKNTIGSPSVIAFENNEPLLFDENLSWLLDCELYGRLYDRYGLPTLYQGLDVAMGIGPHQMTQKLSDQEKEQEHQYLNNKYA